MRPTYYTTLERSEGVGRERIPRTEADLQSFGGRGRGRKIDPVNGRGRGYRTRLIKHSAISFCSFLNNDSH